MVYRLCGRWAGAALAAVFALAAAGAAGQEAFGFGDVDEEAGGGGFALGGFGGGAALDIGGEAGLALTSYLDDYKKALDADENLLSRVWRPGVIHSNLDFTASSALGEAVLRLRFDPAGFVPQDEASDSAALFRVSNVVALDEVYLRAFIQGFELSAGRQRLPWGKADSGGPLDVINPTDMSRMGGGELESLEGEKIPNTMLRGSYRFGQSKLEAVFLPVLEPSILPEKGRFASLATGSLSGVMSAFSEDALAQVITGTAAGLMAAGGAALADPATAAEGSARIAQAVALQGYAAQALEARLRSAEDTTYMNYFQTGVRYTTVFGPVDFGAQYYYGRKMLPAVDVRGVQAGLAAAAEGLAAAKTSADVDAALETVPSPLVYNAYHQAGFDAAWTLAGFSFRAEAAANITEDTGGDDPAVYNPSLGWHLGFDRAIPWDMTFMLMANETIILLHDKIDTSATSHDTEAGTDVTTTRLIASLTKDFLKGDLSVRLAGMVSLETGAFVIAPSATWTWGDFELALTTGFFNDFEDVDGSLNFLSLALTYTF